MAPADGSTLLTSLAGQQGSGRSPFLGLHHQLLHRQIMVGKLDINLAQAVVTGLVRLGQRVAMAFGPVMTGGTACAHLDLLAATRASFATVRLLIVRRVMSNLGGVTASC